MEEKNVEVPEVVEPVEAPEAVEAPVEEAV